MEEQDNHKSLRVDDPIVQCKRCGYEGPRSEMINDTRDTGGYYCGDNCFEQARIDIALDFAHSRS